MGAISDATMLFRKRAFHYFFIRLVASMAPSEMTFFAVAAVAVVAGHHAQQGLMSVGDAAALIAVTRLLADQLSNFVNIQLDIMEGYVSLSDIAEVMNIEVT